MIWLTWRQHRVQLLIGAIVLLVIGAFLLVTGIAMQSSFRDSGLAACLAATPSGCSTLANSWSSQYAGYAFLIPFFLVLPGLAAAFLGSPLIARELEHRTHRMIWTQSVSRVRWLTVKLGVLMAAVLIGSALLTLALTWWSGPLIAAASDNRFDPGVFDLLGVVPAAYALFGVVVGVAAGLILRKTVPAMGATLAAFAAVRVAVAFVLRPNFQPALTDSYSLSLADKTASLSTLPGTWQISAHTVDRAGHLVSDGIGIDFNRAAADCPTLAVPSGGPLPNPVNLQACIHQAGIHVVALYQPGSRYWLFQGLEASLFIAAAGVLLAITFWWVQHRTS